MSEKTNKNEKINIINNSDVADISTNTQNASAISEKTQITPAALPNVEQEKQNVLLTDKVKTEPANSNSNANNSVKATRAKKTSNESAQNKEQEQLKKESERIEKKAQNAQKKQNKENDSNSKLTLEEQNLKEQEKQTRKMRLVRRRRQITGLFSLFLILTGLFTIISGAVGIFTNVFDDTEIRLEYEERMRYVTALDPLPFENINDAQLTTLLYAAMSHAISNEENMDNFEYSEIGALYLPISVINQAVFELYGPDVQFNYSDFTLNSLSFTYDAEREAYLMPITSVPTDFTPIVEDLKRSGNTHIVTIGYDVPYDTVIEPIKYNDYIFTRNDNGNYYLSAIQTSSFAPPDVNSSEVQEPTAIAEPGTVFNSAVEETLPEQAQQAKEDTQSSTSIANSSASEAGAQGAEAQNSDVTNSASVQNAETQNSDVSDSTGAQSQSE